MEYNLEYFPVFIKKKTKQKAKKWKTITEQFSI